MPKSKTGTKHTTKTENASGSEAKRENPSVTERRRLDALIKLGVSPQRISVCTQISHIVKGAGTNRMVLDWVRGSEDAGAREFCKWADALTLGELDVVPIEAICLAAEIAPKKFLLLLMEEVTEQGKIASALLSRAAHPSVVATTVASAELLGKEGVQDRKMLHLAQGFVPVPKTNVSFFPNATIDARSQTVNAALAPVEASVRRISERFTALPAENVPLALPEPENGDDDAEGE